jgi:predicted ATPase
LARSFELKDVKLQDPYLKAKWKGKFEILLNGISVRKLSGDFPDYCGLRLSKKATQALRKGKNILSVRLKHPDATPLPDLGLIDWVHP